MTWYKQTSVWAIVISVIAVVFSQLPPVSDWLPKDHLQVDIGNQIALPTILGAQGYFVLVDFDNQGNRAVNLSRIQLEVVWPNGSLRTLDVRYFSEPKNDNYFFATTLKLKPQERLVYYLTFYPKSSPNEDETMGRLRQKISDSILERRRLLRPQEYTPDTLVEADSKLVAEAIRLFNQRLILETGLYKATLSCEKNGERVNIKTFEFTLYDYHIDTLRSQANDFKYGWGVSGSPDQNKELWATISRVD